MMKASSLGSKLEMHYPLVHSLVENSAQVMRMAMNLALHWEQEIRMGHLWV